jgi:translation elongation factor EF-4
MKNLLLSLTLMAAVGMAADNSPRYDTATVIDLKATVTGVREVPKDQALNGLHLTVQSGADTFDIYIGPSEFVKVFDMTFAKGDKVQVIGSKVKFEGSTVVLAREATMGTVTYLLRDKEGEPLWKFFLRSPQG